MIDYAKYPGEWVVVCNNKVVAHDRDLSRLKSDIKKCKTTPALTLVPKEDVLIF